MACKDYEEETDVRTTLADAHGFACRHDGRAEASAAPLPVGCRVLSGSPRHA